MLRGISCPVLVKRRIYVYIQIVERLFELLPHDLAHLASMQGLLTEYCRSRPLFTYNPAPPQLEDWCIVNLLKRERRRLIYQPMADLTALPTDTQKMIDDMEKHAVKSGYIVLKTVDFPALLHRNWNYVKSCYLLKICEFPIWIKKFYWSCGCRR